MISAQEIATKSVKLAKKKFDRIRILFFPHSNFCCIIVFFNFKIKQKLDDILDRLPDDFNIRELMTKAEDKTPYTIVAIQECERMNMLTEEIRRSLKELNLGLKVFSIFSLIFFFKF